MLEHPIRAAADEAERTIRRQATLEPVAPIRCSLAVGRNCKSSSSTSSCIQSGHATENGSTGTKDGTVHITEAATGKEIRNFSAGSAVPAAGGVSRRKVDGHRLAGLDAISFWDTDNGAPAGQVMVRMFGNYQPDCFAFSPDGQHVASIQVGGYSAMRINGGVGGIFGSLLVLVAELPARPALFRQSCRWRGGQGGGGGQWRCGRSRRAEQVAKEAPVRGIGWRCRWPRWCCGWRRWKSWRRWWGSAGSLAESMSFARSSRQGCSRRPPDGSAGGSCDMNGQLFMWDAKSNMHRSEFNVGNARSLAFIPNRNQVAVATAEGEVHLWDWTQEEESSHVAWEQQRSQAGSYVPSMAVRWPRSVRTKRRSRFGTWPATKSAAGSATRQVVFKHLPCLPTAK